MPEGVNTPAEFIVPLEADQVTAVLKLPVPATLAEQADVCVIWIDAGVQITETDAMDEDAFIAIVAVPDFVVSCVDVAVTIAVPDPLGVNRPDAVMVPPVAVHVTAEL